MSEDPAHVREAWVIRLDRPEATSQDPRTWYRIEALETMAWLGVELYGFKVKDMAEGLDKYIEIASRVVSRAAARRMSDRRFAKRTLGTTYHIVQL